MHNYLEWCSVSVAGATASTAGSQTVCVPAGSVNLTATPVSGFEVWSGMWESGTASKAGTVTGSGVGTGATSATTATVSGATGCVTVCCASDSTGADCAGSNACP